MRFLVGGNVGCSMFLSPFRCHSYAVGKVSLHSHVHASIGLLRLRIVVTAADYSSSPLRKRQSVWATVDRQPNAQHKSVLSKYSAERLRQENCWRRSPDAGGFSAEMAPTGEPGLAREYGLGVLGRWHQNKFSHDHLGTSFPWITDYFLDLSMVWGDYDSAGLHGKRKPGLFGSWNYSPIDSDTGHDRLD